MTKVVETFTPKVISSSTNVTIADNQPVAVGYLGGVFVSAASATPTITIYDDAGTGTSVKIVDTFTPVAATFYPIPAQYRNGCYVVISGTVSCTVFTRTK